MTSCGHKCLWSQMPFHALMYQLCQGSPSFSGARTPLSVRTASLNLMLVKPVLLGQMEHWHCPIWPQTTEGQCGPVKMPYGVVALCGAVGDRLVDVGLCCGR